MDKQMQERNSLNRGKGPEVMIHLLLKSHWYQILPPAIWFKKFQMLKITQFWELMEEAIMLMVSPISLKTYDVFINIDVHIHIFIYL